MKLALAQANFTVGDIDGNASKIEELWRMAEARGADLVIFPEMALTGYPVEDLALRPGFRAAAASALREIVLASRQHRSAALIGSVGELKGRATNSLYLIEKGKTVHSQAKVALPNYGVFDEKRQFRKGPLPSPVLWRGLRLGLLICEDMWQPRLPAHLAEQEIDLFISVNGSPFEADKLARRYALGRQVTTTHGVSLIYVNMVTGQDEIVMDGGSFAMDVQGAITAACPQFEESLTLVDWPLQAKNGARQEAPGTLDQIYRAMRFGLSEYVQKSGFADVVIGLSGGIDSALTAAVAVDALGREHVHPVFLPSPYTSQESYEDARECAKLLGLNLREIPIEPAMRVMGESLSTTFSEFLQSEQVRGGEAGGGSEATRVKPPADITHENLQSRIRGNLLMALSNQFGWLLITTGNKSEMATGYATLYGDMCGAYNPIKDLYKTQVFALARWRNDWKKVMPNRVLTKPPSAELRPNQTDQDSLPPYDLLDAILARLIEGQKTPEEVMAEGFDEATVQRVYTLLTRAEYKRRQAAPGVKLSSLAFGKDWRMPLVNGFKG